MNDNSIASNELGIKEIFKYLPHRYPFLLVDRVLECEPGKSLVAVKNVTINEPFFQGHFPNQPVMPGVLILEALAQAAGILAFKTADATPSEDLVYYMVGIDNARFREPVGPGDQLSLHVTLNRAIKTIWKFGGEARVGNKVAATADLMVAVAFEGDKS
jgi:3-hydroxyacyl-[acyl-carrier-protein] dehydratase